MDGEGKGEGEVGERWERLGREEGGLVKVKVKVKEGRGGVGEGRVAGLVRERREGVS